MLRFFGLHRRLAVVEIRRQRDIALSGQPRAHILDLRNQAPPLLNDHHARPARARPDQMSGRTSRGRLKRHSLRLGHHSSFSLPRRAPVTRARPRLENRPRFLDQVGDAGIDLLPARAEAQYADPAQKAPVRRAAGEHDTAARRHAIEHLARRLILLGQRRSWPIHVEGEKRELRRGQHHDAWNGGDPSRRVDGELPLFGDRGLVARGPEEFYGEPQTESGKSAREVRAMHREGRRTRRHRETAADSRPSRCAPRAALRRHERAGPPCRTAGTCPCAGRG